MFSINTFCFKLENNIAMILHILAKLPSKLVALLFFGLFSTTVLGQNGPGGVGSITGSSDLKLWLRADKNITYNSLKVISKWDDYSYYKNNFVSSSTPPEIETGYINTFPAVNFLSAAASLEKSSVNWTSVFSGSANTVIFVKNSTSGDTWFNWSSGGSNTASFALSSGATAFNFGGTTLTGTAGITGSTKILLSTIGGGNQHIYVNGSQDVTNTNSNTITPNTSTLYLGSKDGTSTNGWVGYISEVIVYNKVLNSAERNIVTNALSAKYNLSANPLYSGYGAGFYYDVVGVGVESDGSQSVSNSEGVRIYTDGSFGNGEYTFIGHNNAVNAATTADCEDPLQQQRWNRTWYLKKTGDVDAKISFDFSEGINGNPPVLDTDYRLLYREATTGNFTAVTTSGSGIENTDQLWFTVANANLLDGYYTIGTLDKQNYPVVGGQVWYTYMDGNWEDWETWTLDPDGSLLINASHSIPGGADSVVIHNGLLVTINDNNHKANYLEIRSGGILDIQGTSGHTFTKMFGAGTLRLSSENYPAYTDASNFIANGTVEYQGGDAPYPAFPQQTNYYNLKINLDAASNKVIVRANIQVTNNLTIQRGIFQINDTGTDKIVITVNGNLTVGTNGSFTVGTGNTIGTYEINSSTSNLPAANEYHKIFHQVYIYGSFTNNGTVKFSNISSPDYDDFTTTGAASLFMMGSSDQSITLNNTTEFYNLVIDKGTSQAYTLTLYSASADYFKLFGPNSVGNLNSSANPEVRKALWIKGGTLKLTGNVSFPTLSEGNDYASGETTSGNYVIGANAALWIDSNNVQVYSNQTNATPAFSIIGTLKVSSGSFSTRNGAGIVYPNYQTGQLIVEGGNVDLSQFRSEDGSGEFTYIQTGGTVTVRGDATASGTVNDSYGIFDLRQAGSSFQMSGGEIVINDNTTYANDLYIASSEENFSVTGGALTLQLSNGESFGINSTANIWNLSIKNLTGSGLFTFAPSADLVVTNSLLVDNYTKLDLTVGSGYNLYVGGNLTISANGEIDALDGTDDISVIFNGSQNSLLTIQNTTTPFNPYKFNVSKNLANSYVKLVSTGYSDNQTPLIISNEFKVTKGIFDYDIFYTEARGSIDNSGTMGLSTASGRILLANNSAQQTITTSVSSSSTYGHIELNDSQGAILDGYNATFSKLTLTTGILDINEYRLTVEDPTIGGSPFSSTKMIKCNGDNSAKGLKLKLTGTYPTGATTRTFPIGFGATYNYTTVVFTPSTERAITGYVTVIPINGYHPTYTGGGGCSGIPYYWKVYADATLATETTTFVDYNFYFSGGIDGGVTEYYFRTTDNDWVPQDAAAIPLAFTDIGFISTDFTAAKNGCFNAVRSFTSNCATNPCDWNAEASWTMSGTGNPRYPTAIDAAYIVSGDEIRLTANNQDVSRLDIQAGGVLDIRSFGSLDFDRVSGGGKIKIDRNATLGWPAIPNGNFEEFLTTTGATWEYYGTTGYTIQTTLPYYPNLVISGSGTKVCPSANLMVNENLYIDGTTLSVASDYDINVNGSVIFNNSGVLQFPNSGTSTLTVGVDIDLSGNTSANTINVASGGSSGSHIIELEGDIIMNNNAVVNLSAQTHKVNLYFTGDENSEISTSTATLALNNLYIQKELVSDVVTINSNFTLPNTQKSLHLETGTLVLNNSSINISLSNNNGAFTIPASGVLNLKAGATATVTGANGYIDLNGKLILDNSSLTLTDGTNNNYITYGSSGLSEIQVNGTSTLTVGSQIRRSSISSAGSLKYSQTGGTVTVGNNSSGITTRGMFEILNLGSTFNFTGGDLIIAQSQISTSPALYIDPASSPTVDPSVYITIGKASVTPNSNIIGLYINAPVQNLKTIDPTGGNSFTAKLFTVSPTLRNLEIAANTIFDCNGINLSLTGNLNVAGTFEANGNTTSFSGATQTISSAGSANFYNLSFYSSNSTTLSNSITINGNLYIASGTILDDNEENINLKGNVNNLGEHTTGSTLVGGLILNGTSRQEISGAGKFGRIEINNSMGASLNNDLTIINNTLKLTLGSLYIRENTFTMGVNSNVIGDFGPTRMIVTNGATSDGGIKRLLVNGDNNDIEIPAGVPRKYTPITLDLNATVSEGGYILIKPINEAHRTAIDKTNVLQYYWIIEHTGLAGITADITFNYMQEDVALTAPNLESDYISAYLQNAKWAKFDKSTVDATNNTIRFTFSNKSTLVADYTAGIENALPLEVPTYYTTTGGVWENKEIWMIEGIDGNPDYPADDAPSGFIVKIRHNVTITEYLKSAYRTIIEGSGQLNVGTTIGHYLGAVSGTGHLKLNFGKLPAGNYDQFFSCSGGTMEFSGTTNYAIPIIGSTYNSLILSGTGTRTLPELDLTICESFLIDGPTVDNTPHNKTITLKGDFELANGDFLSGTGATATLVLTGTSAQTFTGTFTGDSELNNITLNNSSGLTLAGDLTMAGVLTLTNGTITTGSNTLLLKQTSSVSPSGGSSTSFVNGALSKSLASGSSFTFPTGKSSRYGKFVLTNPSSSEVATWKAEYFNTGNQNKSSLGSGIAAVGDEYWRVTPPSLATTSSPVTLRWDALSDINGNSANGTSNIKVVRYTTVWEDQTATLGGGVTNTSGTITTNSAMSFTSSTASDFALGSANVLRATANFATGNVTICDGASTDIYINLTGTSPWSITYSINSGAAIPVNDFTDNPLIITTSTPGIYEILTVSDIGGAGYVDPTTITISNYPVVEADAGIDKTVCAGIGISIGGSPTAKLGTSPFTYLWSPTTYLISSTVANPTATPTVSGNITYTVTLTDANGCTDTDDMTLTVNPYSNAELTAISSSSACQNESVDLTFTINQTSNFTLTLRRKWKSNPAQVTDVALTNSPLTANFVNTSGTTWTYTITSEWVDTGNAIPAKAEFIYEILSFVETGSDCEQILGSTKELIVWKLPVTGPQYHIPNTFGD